MCMLSKNALQKCSKGNESNESGNGARMSTDVHGKLDVTTITICKRRLQAELRLLRSALAVPAIHTSSMTSTPDLETKVKNVKIQSDASANEYIYIYIFIMI